MLNDAWVMVLIFFGNLGDDGADAVFFVVMMMTMVRIMMMTTTVMMLLLGIGRKRDPLSFACMLSPTRLAMAYSTIVFTNY